MRKIAFCPTGLDSLESRIALSTVASAGAVTAEVAKVEHHHEHDLKFEHHEHHEAEHFAHKGQAK